jgi:hypothetical protein
MKGEVSLETWMRYAIEHRDHTHIISGAHRPGCMSFSALVESTLFAPKTPLAGTYSCATLHWQGLDWVIVSVPSSMLDQVREIAKGLCMKFMAGWPSVMSAGVPLQFPGRGSNVRTLENDFHQPIYQDLHRSQAQIAHRELDVSIYLGTGRRLMPAQVLEYIYRDGRLPEGGEPPPSASKH